MLCFLRALASGSSSTPGDGRIGSSQHSRRRAGSEGVGGAPFGGGSEDGAGALLPVASGVVRETRGERSVSIA